MSNYAIGHSVACTDLFLNFPVQKLKISHKEVAKVFSDTYRKDFAAKIFKDCVKLVVKDIVDNNVDFQLPNIGRKKAYLRMLKATGEDFKNAYRKGKWHNIDFIASNFTGYQIGFVRDYEGKMSYTKPVYINKDVIANKVNQGVQY